MARVAKLLLFNTRFKTQSFTCAAPFIRKFVLHSELLWAVMRVLHLKFNVFSLKRESLTCRVYYASCCLLLHLDRSQVQEVNRFEIGNIYEVISSSCSGCPKLLIAAFQYQLFVIGTCKYICSCVCIKHKCL